MKPDVVRPWRADDFALLAAAAPGLSERTLRLRFWGAVPVLPASYLRSTARRWPYAWDAVAALRDGALIGWAEYGRYPDAPSTADLAVCVIDAAQGQGVGTALLQLLIERARGAGLMSVHVDIAPHNTVAQHAWRRMTGGTASDLALVA